MSKVSGLIGWVALAILCGCGGGGGGGSEPASLDEDTPVAIEVSPSTTSLPVGVSGQLAATGLYGDGGTRDLTALVTWEVSNPQVVTVGNGAGEGGQVLGVAPGSAQIQVTYRGVVGTASIAVADAVLTSLQAAPLELQLPLGVSQDLTVTGLFSDGRSEDLSGQVQWRSANESVASVDSAGRVSALAQGSTTVTAAFGGLEATIALSVGAPQLVTLNLSPSGPTLPVGVVKGLRATATFSDGQSFDLTDQVEWSSSSPSIASVGNGAGAKGVVTAVSAGSVTVEATFSGERAEATVTVNNALPDVLKVAPADTRLPLGQQTQFAATCTFDDGSSHEVTGQATWVSSNDAVATVSNAAGTQGLVTPVAEGTAKIFAVWEDVVPVEGGTETTVVDITLDAIEIDPLLATAAPDQEVTFAATGLYSDGSSQKITGSVTWSSSNTAVAQIASGEVDGGRALAKAPGTTTIQAELAGVVATTTLTVQ